MMEWVGGIVLAVLVLKLAWLIQSALTLAVCITFGRKIAELSYWLAIAVCSAFVPLVIAAGAMYLALNAPAEMRTSSIAWPLTPFVGLMALAALGLPATIFTSFFVLRR